ncbi:hypothetical protein [Paracoccus laeviglucosivorans]|uniref:Uncharacterized protein n=1 Tax=Paracoccus laeviglucosivorans TaxID=1197861 RepID=A0A521E7H2_9RHOB|nr:hypothetical protein [Paracoccus laeviglucosivorans]SMO79351.1 hypothetical protein SAMN06265221_11175 [Paracoccus laeviglucosivorans]
MSALEQCDIDRIRTGRPSPAEKKPTRVQQLVRKLRQLIARQSVTATPLTIERIYLSNLSLLRGMQ